MATDVAKGIDLVDNTKSQQPSEQDLSRSETRSSYFQLKQKLTRDSVRNELQKRKYAKWQRERLGAPDPESRSQSLSRTTTKNTTPGTPMPSKGFDNVDILNIAPVQTEATNILKTEENPEASSELEVLYENQRGWFLFGIPFYSSRSLLQFDPPAWVDKEYRVSPVNITNTQVPDPSWEWAWPTWYVDMSDDVDEEGWQYSFSFIPKSGWHGTHPWFHSYVRRRRWVRLRVKKKYARLKNGVDQTDFRMAHMLNEDYFTIHSQNLNSVDPSIAPPTAADVPSSSFSRQWVGDSPERHVEDSIENIPALLEAMKNAIVDRKKIEALRKFLAQGGEELYYLPDKVPEMLSLFVFQTSRWQFLKLLHDALDDANSLETDSNAGKKEIDAQDRRRNNILRTIDAVKKEVSDIGVFDISKENLESLYDSELHEAHRSSRGKGKERSWNEIKGIPKAAGIGKEGHIY
ncbi:conserved hypothetical protein [Talaromyces stipitatus ATCC 10500]|uniref:Peroxin/Ferlin domain-containing protein n=1 Tax=Talaromyces stipitatus (strain ATCC 10500 / CBS 375.48 / QM 6759 / NRRL 1006) TaxID=441959 RepID=B8LUP0_TALSN|nr:uncharacterized protein TSTA_072870 [Talaromyces stipitatus ATCC 10500]EED23897.1 conserved hypothetical protein [Talaromyces stipitatus ATCC 10500]